ncbi:sodium/hydrogen exchanger 1-like [Chenopodium quinoa]|uniref:Sodium/hydrogen exchanger n=1 Tax=Chenopodium quinoa TaxID=63459 RepID=A0A803KPA6_CHEQI|nr:sodium/hydrogen exchanger 1-like [Chenopodium quinoa]
MFGVEKILHESTPFDTSTVISITVFISLICLCIIIGHLLEENRWANESITSLLLGVASGGVVLLIRKGQNSRILVFNEELFFIYLLPPIIFNAGFQVKKKQFFKNFSTILSFGVVGTLISFCLVSVGVQFLLKKIGLTQLSVNDYLALGAILSATDSVCTLQVLNQDDTPLLYSVVFGEGVVNDATSIVLFNAVQSLDLSNLSAMTALALLGTFLYLFITSTLLGVLVGLLSAFIIKKLYLSRHSTDREIALMMLMAYLSYMIAELMDLSGILTVFFCGVVMSHYTWHNVSESSRITSKHAFATMSFISETFIFLYVGMDTLDIDKWKESNASVGTYLAVSSAMLSLILIGRAAFVFPLANILNYTKKNSDKKINFSTQFIIWWAGLMRGAVTVALSYNAFSGSVEVSNERSLMISCTLIVVLFSTLLFGTVTKPLIRAILGAPRHAVSYASDIPSLEYLDIPFLESQENQDNPENQETNLNGDEEPRQRRGGFSLIMKYPTGAVHHIWRKFDNKFMRPVFGGRGFVTYEPASPTGAADISHEQ